jgi:methionyl-tRNA formyltransferase
MQKKYEEKMSIEPVKILFFGGKSWGVHALRILNGLIGHTQREFQIVGIVSNNGDMKKLDYAGDIVKEAAIMKIPLYLPQTNKQLIDLIKYTNSIFGLSVFFDSIISAEALDLFPMGAVNLHMGDAERFRGCFSTMHVLSQGIKEAGVTLHYMDVNIDAGDIIAKKIWKLDTGLCGYDLYLQSLEYGMDILKNELPKLIDGEAKRRPQYTGNTKYYNRELPKKIFSRLDIMENPDLFLNSILSHDFPGFSGLNLSLDGIDYEIIRKSPYKQNVLCTNYV